MRSAGPLLGRGTRRAAPGWRSAGCPRGAPGRRGGRSRCAPLLKGPWRSTAPAAAAARDAGRTRAARRPAPLSLVAGQAPRTRIAFWDGSPSSPGRSRLSLSWPVLHWRARPWLPTRCPGPRQHQSSVLATQRWVAVLSPPAAPFTWPHSVVYPPSVGGPLHPSRWTTARPLRCFFVVVWCAFRHDGFRHDATGPRRPARRRTWHPQPPRPQRTARRRRRVGGDGWRGGGRAASCCQRGYCGCL